MEYSHFTLDKQNIGHLLMSSRQNKTLIQIFWFCITMLDDSSYLKPTCWEKKAFGVEDVENCDWKGFSTSFPAKHVSVQYFQSFSWMFVISGSGKHYTRSTTSLLQLCKRKIQVFHIQSNVNGSAHGKLFLQPGFPKLINPSFFGLLPNRSAPKKTRRGICEPG